MEPLQVQINCKNYRNCFWVGESLSRCSLNCLRTGGEFLTAKAGRLSSEAVQPWEAPTATSTKARRRRVASDMRWRVLRPLLPSWPQHKPRSRMFVAIARSMRELSNASTRTATSLRFQIERQRNEHGKRPSSHNFTQQTSRGFVLRNDYTE